MTKRMNKTVEEVLDNNVWSASKFKLHLECLIKNSKDIILKFGRTVMYIETVNGIYKIYPHYKGKTKDFITLVDPNGNEIKSFHFEQPPKEIVEDILKIIRSE